MKQIKNLGEKEVILCKTIAECNAIAELLHNEGLMWCDGVSYLENKAWLSEDTNVFCFCPDKGEWCWLNYYEEYNYTIHKAKDFLQETTKQVSNEVKEELQDILKEWAESKFQKGLNVIIRERLK